MGIVPSIGNTVVGYFSQDTGITYRTSDEIVSLRWIDSVPWDSLDADIPWDNLYFPLRPDITWEDVVRAPVIKAIFTQWETGYFNVFDSAKVVEIKPEIIIHMGNVEPPVILLSPQVDYAYTPGGRRY